MSLLSPSSIAVIGASREPGKVGHEIFKNLLTQGYKGKVFPVNPKGDEILGKQAYASVKDIPGAVDLAVIVTPASTVETLVEECATKKIEWVIVITAGFGEIHTDDGTAREKALKETATKHGINIVGANCLGVIRTSNNMNASFANELPPRGPVALISQSGAMAVALMDASPALHLGYSSVFSIGNKTVLDECDFLELCEKDDETTVIGMYIESIRDGRRFLETAARVAKKKPVVLLKSGVSEHGKKAASSHTGALAGMDSAIDAVCAQAGLHRAHSAEEFLDLLRVLSTQPVLQSPNIAIVTNAGGPGILATDATERAGLRLPTLSKRTLDRLAPVLPPTAGTVNPVDVIGDAGADRYEHALDIINEDPEVDGIVVILTPQVMTPCADVARVVSSIAKQSQLIPIVTAFMGGSSVREAVDILAQHGIPNFDTPERAVEAMTALLPRSADKPVTPKVQQKRAKAAASLLKGKHGLLSEHDARDLFGLYDLELPAQDIASSPDHAVTIADHIGYPVIAKVSSPDIVHKTDIGGIRANLKTAADVKKAVRDIQKNTEEHAPDATMRGVLIQKFLPVGSEFIIGCVRDPSFGPLIMAGLGGIYTELFRDTAFRLAPITPDDAYAMLRQLKAWKLLLGMRGAAQADIDALATALVRISTLIAENDEILELDCNPVLVGSKAIVIADVKVIVA